VVVWRGKPAVELKAEPACFFNGTLFLLESMTDRQTIYLAGIFLESNEISLSLQGKQLTAFVGNDEN